MCVNTLSISNYYTEWFLSCQTIYEVLDDASIIENVVELLSDCLLKMRWHIWSEREATDLSIRFLVNSISWGRGRMLQRRCGRSGNVGSWCRTVDIECWPRSYSFCRYLRLEDRSIHQALSYATGWKRQRATSVMSSEVCRPTTMVAMSKGLL